MSVQQQSTHQQISEKSEGLEMAKRRAAVSFAKMSSATDAAQHSAWVSATTRDELDVLRARVDVLSAMMQKNDPELCLENSGPTRVCVTYDRVRLDHQGAELGPMQSTMSWAVPGAGDELLRLTASEEQGPPVRRLLELVRSSAPRKLQILCTLLAGAEPPDSLRAGVPGMNEDGHNVQFQVERVPLDVSAWEGWQNPSTNALIRQSILSTAPRETAWTTVASTQIRVTQDGEECHKLTFTPFTDSESCTVSHLQYTQSVFDGGSQGILNLSEDPARVQPLTHGTILPLRAYVCLGAHRNGRLGEAQLNYVHSRGVLAHGFDTKMLPPTHAIQWGTDKIPAKATRVSSKGVDVMASSFHVADQVYTTISVVQYPPFGTHHEERRHVKSHLPFKTGFEQTVDGGFALPAQGLFAQELSGKQTGSNKTEDKRKKQVHPLSFFLIWE